MADEAGQAIARPLLAAAAPGLITITAGGKSLTPVSSDCPFEVHDDVAFILNFQRPEKWPAVVEATFFERFTTLDTGTISVFDYTASRFSRDLEPIAQAIFDQASRSLSFTLESPTRSESPLETALVRPPAAAASTARKFTAVSVFLGAAVVTGLLVYQRLKRAV